MQIPIHKIKLEMMGEEGKGGKEQLTLKNGRRAE